MISQAEFDNVAKLAGLQIPADKQEAFRHKMEQVVELIDPLRTLDIQQMRYDLGIPVHTPDSKPSFVQS